MLGVGTDADRTIEDSMPAPIRYTETTFRCHGCDKKIPLDREGMFVGYCEHCSRELASEDPSALGPDA